MAKLCVPLYLVSFLATGVIANSAEFQTQSGPTQVVPFWEAAVRLYLDVFSSLTQIPQMCVSGSIVNDFQANQCSLYWDHLIKAGGLSFLPLGIVGIFLYLSFDYLSSTYKKTRKRIEKKKAAFKGTVTHPPEGPADFYSWFFCFRTIIVETQNKNQVKVYVPLDGAAPHPGETLAVFEPIYSFGEKRHIAMVYAPHVAVVRGE